MMGVDERPTSGWGEEVSSDEAEMRVVPLWMFGGMWIPPEQSGSTHTPTKPEAPVGMEQRAKDKLTWSNYERMHI